MYGCDEIVANAFKHKYQCDRHTNAEVDTV